jgi:hypothetical protein
VMGRRYGLVRCLSGAPWYYPSGHAASRIGPPITTAVNSERAILSPALIGRCRGRRSNIAPSRPTEVPGSL